MFKNLICSFLSDIDPDGTVVYSPSLLDIGCGPSISNIISASKRTSNIILADYLESNRREVERFWKVCENPNYALSKTNLSVDFTS